MMKSNIYFKEKLTINQSVKHWVFSIILLIDFIVYTLLWHFYHTGKIPSEKFDEIGINITIIISIFFSLLIIFILFLKKYTLTINENELSINSGFGIKKNILKDEILYYKKIQKKEARDLMNIHNKRKKEKSIKVYCISFPNYILLLKNGEKILVETEKIASFEYMMNKLLKSNG